MRRACPLVGAYPLRGLPLRMQEKSMNAKRGYVPEDERNFSPEAVEKMCKGTWYLYRSCPADFRHIAGGICWESEYFAG